MLTPEQVKVMATATVLAHEGKGFAAKEHDRAVCDGLVESGHLRRVEGGYTITPEFAAALGGNGAKLAEQARNN